jgi:hypothetical protein
VRRAFRGIIPPSSAKSDGTEFGFPHGPPTLASCP